jgi:hypothetical protein
MQKAKKPHEKRKRAAKKILAQLTEFRSIWKTIAHSCMTVGTRVAAAGGCREKEIDKSNGKKI